jgi:3-oxoacyl-[acyl-carrier protein] reductase
MLLNGKWAVITGCNRGIGKAMLDVFSASGANIWAWLSRQDPFLWNAKQVICIALSFLM